MSWPIWPCQMIYVQIRRRVFSPRIKTRRETLKLNSNVEFSRRETKLAEKTRRLIWTLPNTPVTKPISFHWYIAVMEQWNKHPVHSLIYSCDGTVEQTPCSFKSGFIGLHGHMFDFAGYFTNLSDPDVTVCHEQRHWSCRYCGNSGEPVE